MRAQSSKPSGSRCAAARSRIPARRGSVIRRAFVEPQLLVEPETLTQGTYAVLASALVSFGLTFGVAPRFRSSFKEDDAWRDMFADLSRRGVESISPQESVARVSRGATLVDVRLQRKWAQSAMPVGINIPLYQPISGWGLAANIRRAGFAFFGIFGTERNEGWLSQVIAQVPKDKEVIVACEMGGSMEIKPGADAGFQSQSLKAVYFLKQAGYRKVLHMKGGVDEYRRTVGPLEVVDEPAASDAVGNGRLSARVQSTER